ncbi:MAG: arylsulfatase [bacterium]|nr:arylsulfatase [bacterium]
MPNERTARSLSRRDVLKLGAGAAAASTLTLSGGIMAQSTSADRKPNILFLMADQYRGDCLGVMGHPVVKTPHLDRIAREGVNFRCGYSTTPTCTPARAGLLTGQGPWRHGMLGYGKVAEQYPVEMVQTLRDAGYYTFGIGKMHWHPQRNFHGFHNVLLDESSRVEHPAFRSDYRAWFMSEAPHLQYDATLGGGWNDYRAAEYVLPEELHPTHWTGERAVRFIDNYDREEPFFLKVSFARPHSPYDAPPRFWRMYDDADIPEAYVGDWEASFGYEKRSQKDNNIWHGDMGPDQVRKSRQGYYGNVTFIDEEIGRVLAALERQGMLDNTLILFTADHGDMTGDHHMWRKSYPYEASAHVPMVMRWPDGMGGERGQVLEHPVELRDIFPTFADAAGASDATEGLDGASMLPLVRDDDAPWREYIDLEHDVCYSTKNHWNALTDGHIKYVYHAFDGREQLFDMDIDPGECTDLAPDRAHRKTLKLWRARMVDHLAERGDQWVKDGKLVPRPKRMLYSPNYPKTESGEKA